MNKMWLFPCRTTKKGNALVSQLVEKRILNPKVLGSSPSGRTQWRAYAPRTEAPSSLPKYKVDERNMKASGCKRELVVGGRKQGRATFEETLREATQTVVVGFPTCHPFNA